MVRADFGRNICAVKIWFKWGWVRVRTIHRHVIYVPVPDERAEDVVVAEVLGRRADRVAFLIITCDDLHHFESMHYHKGDERADLILATILLRPGFIRRRNDCGIN
jgi:hypothetical protein